MAVDDHGLEAIKKSAEPTTTGSKADYYLKVGVFGKSQIPTNADAITAEYPDLVTEVFKYRQGGTSGTVLKTVTIAFTDSTKEFISSVVWV